MYIHVILKLCVTLSAILVQSLEAYEILPDLQDGGEREREFGTCRFH